MSIKRRSAAPPGSRRTTVAPVTEENVRDHEAHRALRLIRVLRALFPDSVIDIDALPSTPDSQSQED